MTGRAYTTHDLAEQDGNELAAECLAEILNAPNQAAGVTALTNDPMMANLIAVKGANIATMSSKEMADLTEKRHDNVKRLIETLASKGVITLPQIEEVTNDGPGVPAYLI